MNREEFNNVILVAVSYCQEYQAGSISLKILADRLVRLEMTLEASEGLAADVDLFRDVVFDIDRAYGSFAARDSSGEEQPQQGVVDEEITRLQSLL